MTGVQTCALPILAELGADGSALLVDPRAPDQIAQAMTDIADNASLRQRLIQAGLRRSKSFAWDKRIKTFLDVIVDQDG